MRIFVTGVGGQLGHDVMNELAKRGYEGMGSEDRKSTRLNSSHIEESRMPSSA